MTDGPPDDEGRRAPREPMEGGSDGTDFDDATGAAIGWGLCDACDLDCGGCNLLRLSLVLSTAALLVPPTAGRLVVGLIRAYRRRLSRFTPACPATPSCSAYALAAVETFGPRPGLAAAARRVRTCRSPALQAGGSTLRTSATASGPSRFSPAPAAATSRAAAR